MTPLEELDSVIANVAATLRQADSDNDVALLTQFCSMVSLSAELQKQGNERGSWLELEKRVRSLEYELSVKVGGMPTKNLAPKERMLR